MFGSAYSFRPFLLLCFCTYVWTLYSNDGPVHILTPDNFDSIVTNAPIPSVVEYFAPWCGHCQALAPQYTKAADNLKGLVNVGAVDCDDKQNSKLCRDAGVSGFPTIQIYSASKQKNPYTGKWQKISDNYKGDRRAKEIVNAALVQLSDKHISKVTSGDEYRSFEVAAGKLPIVVLFTSKAKSTSLYQSLSLRYRGRAAFAEVQQSAAAVVEKFGITSFPTLLLITGDGEEKRYDGALKPLGLIDFIDQYAASKAEGEEFEDASSAPPPPQRDNAPPPDAEQPSVVLPWSLKQFQEHMDKDGIWLVAFYKGAESDSCQESLKALNKAIFDTQASIAQVAAVKLSEEEMGEVSQYIDVDALNAQPCKLQIVLMPHEDKDLEEWPKYEGEVKGKPLQDWALALYPNMVMRLGGDNVDAFLMADKDLPKVVLFTNKATTPPTYSALAYNMRMYNMLFTEIHSGDPALLARFQVKKVPALLIMTFSDSDTVDKAGFRISGYPGPLKYIYMLMFLQQQAQAMGAMPKEFQSAMEESMGSSGAVVEVTDQDTFEQQCNDSKLGLCVIAALDTRHDDFAKHLDLLKEVHQAHSSDPLHWLWIHTPAAPSFVQHFGVLPGATPSLVVLSPKKLRFKLMTASFTSAGISRTLKEVMGGQTATLPLDALPMLVKEEPVEEVQEEIVDEEFDLADIMSEEVDQSVGGTKQERLKEAERKLKEEEEHRKVEKEEAERKAKEEAKKKSKKKRKAKKSKSKKKSSSKDEL